MSSLLAVTTPRSIIYLGLDVHKDSIIIAVLPNGAKVPTRLEKLPNDVPTLKKWLPALHATANSAHARPRCGPVSRDLSAEILKSCHYILKFLATRGFVFREGTNRCTPHLKWLQQLNTDGSPLAPEDRVVYREYHALLLYKLQLREELDRQIEPLAELPTLKPMVRTLQCVYQRDQPSMLPRAHVVPRLTLRECL